MLLLQVCFRIKNILKGKCYHRKHFYLSVRHPPEEGLRIGNIFVKHLPLNITELLQFIDKGMIEAAK